MTKITLDDAGITLADVDGMVTAFSFVESTLMHATTFADYLGMEPGYFASIAVGGATAPLMAVRRPSRSTRASRRWSSACVATTPARG